MPQDQRFEYCTISNNSRSFEQLEKRLNALAEEGWQLEETAESGGRTVEFILERPVE